MHSRQVLYHLPSSSTAFAKAPGQEKAYCICAVKRRLCGTGALHGRWRSKAGSWETGPQASEHSARRAVLACFLLLYQNPQTGWDHTADLAASGGDHVTIEWGRQAHRCTRTTHQPHNPVMVAPASLHECWRGPCAIAGLEQGIDDGRSCMYL